MPTHRAVAVCHRAMVAAIAANVAKIIAVVGVGDALDVSVGAPDVDASRNLVLA